MLLDFIFVFLTFWNACALKLTPVEPQEPSCTNPKKFVPKNGLPIVKASRRFRPSIRTFLSVVEYVLSALSRFSNIFVVPLIVGALSLFLSLSSVFYLSVFLTFWCSSFISRVFVSSLSFFSLLLALFLFFAFFSDCVARVRC